jgi:hypothetical protein
MCAFRGEQTASDAAMAALDDDTVDLLYSRVVELEVIPKSVFFKKTDEVAFYEAIFAKAARVECNEKTIDLALDRGKLNGLSMGDALHVECAIAGGADELVTMEGKNKLPRAPNPGIAIRTLRK